MSTSPSIYLVCAIIGLAAYPLSAAAQTTPTYAVSITEPYELVEEVGTTRRITRAEIEARSARTLDEALQLVPGIYVRTGGDGTPRVDVRGFRSRHVLLLVNGVQVNSTADGQFDPARMSTQAIREIKITYGTSSVLYGDNALAAVIEITTLDEKPDATVDLNAGTPDQIGVGARYARSRGNWSVAATATGHDGEAYRLADAFTPTSLEDGGRRQNSDRGRNDLRLGGGYRFSPAISLASEWTLGTGSYGIPGSVINDSSDIFAQTPRFERIEDYRAASGQASVLVAPTGRFNLRGWVFRNTQREDRNRYDDATYSSMDDPLVSGTFQSRERTTVTGSSALARFDLGRVGWARAAFNQRREAFESDGVIRDVPVGGSGGGGGGGGGGRGGGSRPPTFDMRSFSTSNHVDVYSAGGEWQVRPARRLGAVLGAAVNIQRRPGGDTESGPTWIAGASYDATGELRLHASATRKVRVPSIDQLYNASSGNAALRAEHAYSVDTGATWRFEQASTLALSAFVTHAHDFIERISGAPFENQDAYRFRGAELTMQTTRIARVDLRGAYMFLDSDDVTSEADVRPLQTRPRHRANLEWRWTPVTGSAVRGSVYGVGSQIFDSRGSDPLQMEADGYMLVDVGFTQTLARRIDVAFDVRNLFDVLYEQSYGLPREGRSALLTVRARLD